MPKIDVDWNVVKKLRRRKDDLDALRWQGGNFLRLVVAKKGLTQAEVARICEIDEAGLRRALRGVASLERVVYCLEKLGVKFTLTCSGAYYHFKEID